VNMDNVCAMFPLYETPFLHGGAGQLRDQEHLDIKPARIGFWARPAPVGFEYFPEDAWKPWA